MPVGSDESCCQDRTFQLTMSSLINPRSGTRSHLLVLFLGHQAANTQSHKPDLKKARCNFSTSPPHLLLSQQIAQGEGLLIKLFWWIYENKMIGYCPVLTLNTGKRDSRPLGATDRRWITTGSPISVLP